MIWMQWTSIRNQGDGRRASAVGYNKYSKWHLKDPEKSSKPHPRIDGTGTYTIDTSACGLEPQMVEKVVVSDNAPENACKRCMMFLEAK